MVRRCGELGRFAIVGELPWVGRVLRLCGCGVIEILEERLYVARHGHVACACLVVPLEGESEVDPAAPV